MLYSLSSPHHTIVTHLSYLQPEKFHPEIAAKAINPNHLTGEKAAKVVIKIKQILDAEGIYIEVGDIPTDPNWRDSAGDIPWRS